MYIYIVYLFTLCIYSTLLKMFVESFICYPHLPPHSPGCFGDVLEKNRKNMISHHSAYMRICRLGPFKRTGQNSLPGKSALINRIQI